MSVPASAPPSCRSRYRPAQSLWLLRHQSDGTLALDLAVQISVRTSGIRFPRASLRGARVEGELCQWCVVVPWTLAFFVAETFVRLETLHAGGLRRLVALLVPPRLKRQEDEKTGLFFTSCNWQASGSPAGRRNAPSTAHLSPLANLQQIAPLIGNIAGP